MAVKTLALLLPLWLALATGETSVVHACPTHGGVASVTGGEQHAGLHGGMHGAHAPRQAPAAPEHTHGGCSCVGACVTGNVMLAPDAPGIASIPIRSPSTTPSVVWQAERATTSRLLPFANGPPVRVS